MHSRIQAEGGEVKLCTKPEHVNYSPYLQVYGETFCNGQRGMKCPLYSCRYSVLASQLAGIVRRDIIMQIANIKVTVEDNGRWDLPRAKARIGEMAIKHNLGDGI